MLLEAGGSSRGWRISRSIATVGALLHIPLFGAADPNTSFAVMWSSSAPPPIGAEPGALSARRMPRQGSCSIRPSIATGTDVSGLPKRIAAQEGTGRKHIETGREVDESTGTGRHPAAVFLQNPATRRTSVSAQGPFQNYRHSAPARTWFEDDNRVLPDGCIRRSVSDRRVCARGAGADGPSVAAGPPDRSRRCRTW